jgi:hypothetical protein
MRMDCWRIANAGHIPPYLAGKELPLENGLPLGLAAGTGYAECSFQLVPGQQLTLLTDGVVEARDHAGTLFGFERSAALSIEPAEAIARTAQAFGQDDDITVLTLSYAGVPVSVWVEHAWGVDFASAVNDRKLAFSGRTVINSAQTSTHRGNVLDNPSTT